MDGLTDRVAGSESAFAHTDVVSNHTVFTDLRCYAAMLRNESLPAQTFSSFVHEATHHWCFISPIGTTLSLLYLSAAKSALRWAVLGEEVDLSQTLDDLCTFEIAVNWLRPLNEGLAQFAEYDVQYSGVAPLYSPPLTATLNFLLNMPARIQALKAKKNPKYVSLLEAEGEDTAAFYSLMDEVTMWRLSRQVVERKSELLLQPIGSAGSAYLLGYMTVKQLWRRAAGFCKELEHADVFMMFLRKLVFGDFALVAALLDRKKTAFRRGLNFGKAIHDRLELVRSGEFAREPWSKWAEALWVKPRVDEDHFRLNLADPAAIAFLHTEKATKKGLDLYRKLYVEVIHPIEFPRPKTVKKWLKKAGMRPDLIPESALRPDYFFNLLQQRDYMWVGTVPATWKDGDPGSIDIMVEGVVVIDNYKLPDDYKEWLKKLTINIFVEIYDLILIATIGNEDDVVGMRWWGNISESARSKLRNNPINPFEIDRPSRFLHDLLGAYAGRANFRQVLEKFWAKGARELLDHTYQEFAFNGNEEAKSLFAKKGLAEILENDGDLVRHLAVISLAASAGMSPERMNETSKDFQIETVATIGKLNKLWPFEDLPLATVGGDGFLASSV